MLQEITDLTGGGTFHDPREAFTLNRHRSRVSSALWPWLVGAVTGLLVPEIALRRVGAMLDRVLSAARARR